MNSFKLQMTSIWIFFYWSHNKMFLFSYSYGTRDGVAWKIHLVKCSKNTSIQIYILCMSTLSAALQALFCTFNLFDLCTSMNISPYLYASISLWTPLNHCFCVHACLYMSMWGVYSHQRVIRLSGDAFFRAIVWSLREPTHFCLWLSTSSDQTSPGWCTLHPSSAPGLGVSWVCNYTLLWQSCLQNGKVALEAVEVMAELTSPGKNTRLVAVLLKMTVCVGILKGLCVYLCWGRRKRLPGPPSSRCFRWKA